jgi:hypothetical protein
VNETRVEDLIRTVRAEFSPEFVERFEMPGDLGAAEITNRVLGSVAPRDSGRAAGVYLSAFDAAKAGGYPVLGVEDDGTEYIADPRWVAAWKAAFNAAIAYAYADMLTPEEEIRLREPWEAARSDRARRDASTK